MAEHFDHNPNDPFFRADLGHEKEQMISTFARNMDEEITRLLEGGAPAETTLVDPPEIIIASLTDEARELAVEAPQPADLREFDQVIVDSIIDPIRPPFSSESSVPQSAWTWFKKNILLRRTGRHADRL